MPALNIRAAGAEGYTQAEIADYLAEKLGRDIGAMRNEGYSDAEIVAYLAEKDVEQSGPARAPQPEPDNSAGQWAQVAADALSPYFAAGGAGALAGAPFAGVGALPGAAGGVLSLGLGDLATGVYNTAAPLFGGERVALPSESIRNTMREVGVGRAPQTRAQNVASQTLSGAAGAFGGAGSLGILAPRVGPGVTQNVMNTLAQAPVTQAAAGAGASAAPAVANQYLGVEDPLALYGLSMAGGMAGGRAANPRPTQVTSEDLRRQAQAAYTRAEQAGVQFEPASVADLGSNIRQSFTTHPSVQFDPALHPRINTALNRISEAAAAADAAGTPISFSQLELLRRVARTAANSLDRDERRLGAQIIQQIDDFVQAPPANAVLSGAAPDAATAVQQARDAWRRMSQADALDNMVARATNSAEGLTANSIRSQARTVANNPNRMRGFDGDIQRQIADLARGRGGLAILQNVGRLAPTMSPRDLRSALPVAGAGYGLYSGNPGLAATGVVLSGLAAAGRGQANRMASNRMQAMADQARGTPAMTLPASVPAQAALQAVPDNRLPDGRLYEGTNITVSYDPADWDANGNYIRVDPVFEEMMADEPLRVRVSAYPRQAGNR